jgi:hypothetical protein
MELRHHPRMTYQGRCNWPPEWKGPYGPRNPLPHGEVGVLVRVDTVSTILGVPHCVLVIQWNDEEYFGSLYFEDEAFMQRVVIVLRDRINRPISEIGSIDMPVSP